MVDESHRETKAEEELELERKKRRMSRHAYLDPWKSSVQVEPLLPFSLAMKDADVPSEPKELLLVAVVEDLEDEDHTSQIYKNIREKYRSLIFTIRNLMHTGRNRMRGQQGEAVDQMRDMFRIAIDRVEWFVVFVFQEVTETSSLTASAISGILIKKIEGDGITNTQIKKFWRQTHIIEEEHLFAALCCC
ncbi:hypothetical protein F2Q70_00027465 [Brassica cretica]|uniref:Uncharacterized protein n=1 Tax=Brassica cretica TaxID=69181 RepID=A0A8S9LFF4_BRACR|nr:hypothetical protein F2Q70_00027465 [Brassica cretica]